MVIIHLFSTSLAHVKIFKAKMALKRTNKLAFKVALDDNIAFLGLNGHHKRCHSFTNPELTKGGIWNIKLAMLHSLMTFLCNLRS